MPQDHQIIFPFFPCSIWKRITQVNVKHQCSFKFHYEKTEKMIYKTHLFKLWWFSYNCEWPSVLCLFHITPLFPEDLPSNSLSLAFIACNMKICPIKNKKKKKNIIITIIIIKNMVKISIWICNLIGKYMMARAPFLG